MEKKTVSLVLGSGGARGLAHIGIIRWLEEKNFEIKSISGCSMGALIGGVFAAGKIDDVEQWMRALSKGDMISLLDLAWDKSGFVKGDKVINALVDLVGDRMIEDLPIRYTAVATDIKNEKEIWINSGNLFDAIRASISLPLFFTPFKRNELNLIDGGVLNPVPIAPTFSDNTDLTIAVNLGGPVELRETTGEASTAEEKESTPWTEKISQFIEGLQSTGKKITGRDWDMYDIVNESFDAMQGTIARHKLAVYPPDHEILIARNACGTLEFDRATEMIELGYRKAETVLGSIAEKNGYNS